MNEEPTEFPILMTRYFRGEIAETTVVFDAL